MHKLIALLLILSAASHGLAADAHIAVVTDANLLANERFWPYQVAQGDSVGVLIRVETGGVARIDFGRDGLRDVPVDQTDLLERANRIRSGELEKAAPNFALALGPRLADSAGDALRALPFENTSGRPGFVCVFADPAAESFPALAASLAPLRERHGVMTILFPQGEHSDAKLRDRLRELGWQVPFVFDHLSEPYTRTLLPTGTRPPAVILQTNEGRVLLESAWRPDLVPELTLALDRAFGATPAASAGADRK